jgi:hypothetical protein
VDQDLVEGTSRVRNESLKLNANLLRLHILSEREGKLLLLAGWDLNVVLNGRQVSDNAGVTGAVLGKVLESVQRARDEGDLDGVGVLVGDLDDSLGRATVDKLHAENVGFGERSLDLGLKGSLGSGIGIRGVLNREIVSFLFGAIGAGSSAKLSRDTYLGDSAEDVRCREGKERSLEEHVRYNL